MSELKTDTTAREAARMTRGWWFLVFIITLAVPVLLIGAIFFDGRLWLWVILFVVGWFIAVVKTASELAKTGYYTDKEKEQMKREAEEKDRQEA